MPRKFDKQVTVDVRMQSSLAPPNVEHPRCQVHLRIGDSQAHQDAPPDQGEPSKAVFHTLQERLRVVLSDRQLELALRQMTWLSQWQVSLLDRQSIRINRHVLNGYAEVLTVKLVAQLAFLHLTACVSVCGCVSTSMTSWLNLIRDSIRRMACAHHGRQDRHLRDPYA